MSKIAILLIALCAAFTPDSGQFEAKTVRSAAERSAFIRSNPCPATGQRRGACPGFEVDHVQALCAGGVDHHSNMQWLTVAEHRAKTRQDVKACRTRSK